MFIKQIYRTIDELPLWNYNKAFEDVRYLYRLKSYDKLSKKRKILEDIFEEIYYQIVDQIGEKGEIQLYRNKKLTYLHLYWKYVVSEDRKFLTRIRLLEKELEKFKDILQARKQSNLYEQISIIGRHRGGEFIDPKVITVAQWINYIKEYEDFVRKENERNRKKPA